MNFLDLKDISERYMELVNPSSPEKVLRAGQALGLRPESRVIDFGCGFAEPLRLWAQHYGIRGVGIDVREYACARARQKLAEHGFADRIEIVCGNAAAYQFEPHAFDAAACLGASFIFGGYRKTIQALKRAIHAAGRLVIGEPSWRTDLVPHAYAERSRGVHTELELLHITREEGFDLQTIVRSSEEDWDRYLSDDWYGLLRWLEEHPDHPERQEVVAHLHQSQEEYLRFGRQYFGWAIYVLTPVRY